MAIPGMYSVLVSPEKVAAMAGQGRMRATYSGGAGLYRGELRYTGKDVNGVERDDMFGWGCYHAHRTRKAATACATKAARQLAKAATTATVGA
jgi:hypothetical protein